MMLHTGGRILGDFASQPRCEKPEAYFLERNIWLDCRAPDCIVISEQANIGKNVAIITLSHDPRPGRFETLYGRMCRIDALAFVAGFCILYNCHIGEGAVVSLGSCVRSMTVEPWTMVAGNPARPIMRLIEGDWRPV